MADRGFYTADDFPTRVKLNNPAFLKENDELTLKEETSTWKVASVHGHIERAIDLAH